MTEQPQQLLRERDEAKRQLAALEEDNRRFSRNNSELLKLRGEVGQLRERFAEIKEQNRSLSIALAGDSHLGADAKIWIKRYNDISALSWGLTGFQAKHQMRLPDELHHIFPFINDGLMKPLAVPETNRFELVAPGLLVTSVTNQSSVIVIREKEIGQLNGKPTKLYIFADGHIDAIPEPEGGFDNWERQHTVLSPAAKP